jgi:hypothetical protein
MSKFMVAGVSKNSKGQWKMRYSTLSVADTNLRQLAARNTDIFLTDLPKAMSREEAAKYLTTVAGIKANADFLATVNRAVGITTVAAVKMPVKPAAVKVDAKIAELAGA